MRGERHDAAALLLAALAELAADGQAGAGAIEVAPAEAHRLLTAQAGEAQYDGETVLPAAQGVDAGVHLFPGRCDGRPGGLAGHAQLAGRREQRAMLLVVEEPGPCELDDLDKLA